MQRPEAAVHFCFPVTAAMTDPTINTATPIISLSSITK
jgi:hypothetical protein